MAAGKDPLRLIKRHSVPTLRVSRGRYAGLVNVNELTAQIRAKHRRVLASFLKEIHGPGGRTDAHNVDDPSRRNIPRIPHVQSMDDPRVDISLVGDIAALDWFTSTPGLKGSVLTISIAGHHRLMKTRTSLPTGECDAWAGAVLGEDLIKHAYRAGTLSGSTPCGGATPAGGRLTTVYYRLFLDENGHPMERPEAMSDRELRRMDEL